jgi:hypothetical protein
VYIKPSNLPAFFPKHHFYLPSLPEQRPIYP